MDFTISKEQLIAAVDKCSLATDKSHTQEAFRSMMVNASKSKTVGFSATGEYCSVDTVADAEVKTKGSFNVMPGRLREIANAMPSGKIQFSLKGTRVTVKSLVSTRKATFESRTIDPFKVDDPGAEAPWIEIDAQKLLAAITAAKAASTWTGRADPNGCLLVPTDRGLSVFGCNMYLLARVDTDLKVSGEPIVMPATASAVLALMAPQDEFVRLLVQGGRVYMENRDTLVSALLFEYKFLQHYQQFWSMIEDPANVAGPTLSLPNLAQGVKAVLACNGFAGEKERDGTYGSFLHLRFGEKAEVGLDLAEASARDEFAVIRTGAEVACEASSSLLSQAISSFGSTAEVQVLLAFHDPTEMLVLRTRGLTYGLMTRSKK